MTNRHFGSSRVERSAPYLRKQNRSAPHWCKQKSEGLGEKRGERENNGEFNGPYIGATSVCKSTAGTRTPLDQNNGFNNGHLRLPPPACASQPLAHALHSTNNGHYVIHQRVQVNRWRTHSHGPKWLLLTPSWWPWPTKHYSLKWGWAYHIYF